MSEKPKERFKIIRTEEDGPDAMFLIWDTQEKHVIDVMTREECENYNLNRIGVL